MAAKYFVYCPTCGEKLEVELYDNPKVRRCSECFTVFEMLERPRKQFVEEET